VFPSPVGIQTAVRKGAEKHQSTVRFQPGTSGVRSQHAQTFGRKERLINNLRSNILCKKENVHGILAMHRGQTNKTYGNTDKKRTRATVRNGGLARRHFVKRPFNYYTSIAERRTVNEKNLTPEVPVSIPTVGGFFYVLPQSALNAVAAVTPL